MTTLLGHISVTSDDTWKDEELSRRDDIIQHVRHMLTLRYTYGHLG